MKYKPLDKYELFKLVQDESIYLGDIDTSAITDMSFLFNTNFRKDFSGIDKWDVSCVTNMNEMFYCCFGFNENLQSWNVSSVENMDYMFSGCLEFDQPLSNWVVKNVKSVSGMFAHCIKFNQDLSSWYMPSLENANDMFFGCISLNKPSIRSTYNLQYAKAMFSHCISFNQNLDDLVVNNIKDFSFMFYDCFEFNQPLSTWDTMNALTMEMMFAGCHRLNQNLNHFDVSNVENMRFIFSCCFDFKHKLNWDIKETCDTESAFDEDVLENSKEQKNLITPKTKAELKTLVNDNAVDLAQIDISLIDDLSSLFENSERKDFSGIESWDVSHVKSIKAMFQNAKNFNVNLNRWDVGNVEDFSYVFCGCWNLDCYMSNWNTKNSKAEKMYHNCPNVYINRISINYIEKTKK